MKSKNFRPECPSEKRQSNTSVRSTHARKSRACPLSISLLFSESFRIRLPTRVNWCTKDEYQAPTSSSKYISWDDPYLAHPEGQEDRVDRANQGWKAIDDFVKMSGSLNRCNARPPRQSKCYLLVLDACDACEERASRGNKCPTESFQRCLECLELLEWCCDYFNTNRVKITENEIRVWEVWNLWAGLIRASDGTWRVLSKLCLLVLMQSWSCHSNSPIWIKSFFCLFFYNFPPILPRFLRILCFVLFQNGSLVGRTQGTPPWSHDCTSIFCPVKMLHPSVGLCFRLLCCSIIDPRQMSNARDLQANPLSFCAILLPHSVLFLWLTMYIRTHVGGTVDAY